MVGIYPTGYSIHRDILSDDACCRMVQKAMLQEAMVMTSQHLYPLWWLITESCRQCLLNYQKKYYSKGIKKPEKPLAVIPVDWDKEIRKVPSRSRQ